MPTPLNAAASPSGPGGAPRGLLSPQVIGILMVLAGAFFWSTSGVVLKLMAKEQGALPSVMIAGIRAGFAGLVLIPFLMRLTLGWNPLRWDWRMIPLLGGYTATVLCFTTAIRFTTAANAIALTYTAPAWVFVLTCIVERRVPWRLSIPVALILVGLGTILAEPAHGTSLVGNALGLCAGLGFGLFTFLVPRLRQPPIGLVSLTNLFAATTLFAVFHGQYTWSAVTLSDWAVLVYLGVFQIALGHLFFMNALNRIPATQASVMALAEPMLNPLWVWIFIGEVPSGYGLAGLGVILAGVCVDVWLRRGVQVAPGKARGPASPIPADKR